MGSSEALPSCQRWRINELVRKKKRGCKGGWIHPQGEETGLRVPGLQRRDEPSPAQNLWQSLGCRQAEAVNLHGDERER